MNIAYMIWMEPLDSPILESQVINLLKVLKTISPTDTYYIFAFQPIYSILLYHTKYRSIRDDLKNNNIRLIIIPSLVTPGLEWFKAKWYLIPLIFIQCYPILLVLVILNKIDILHCRSYPTMLAPIEIIKAKKQLKIIFDPRSPFPEEGITANRWNKKSISYKIWKGLERKFLNDSDVTIAIADTYVKYFSAISGNAYFVKIPNNVDTIKFTRNQDYNINIRSKMGIREKETIFVYVGSLGSHWNNPAIYARFMISLRKLDSDHRFMFITPDRFNLMRVFNEYNIKTYEYIVISANLSDVPKYLSSADVGLNFMGQKDIRMSVKTCEYLAMGLPVIVNSNVMGAKEIIEKYHVGLVLEDLNNINLDDIKGIILQKKQFAVECRKVASENFSTMEVAKQYLKTYKILNAGDRI